MGIPTQPDKSAPVQARKAPARPDKSVTAQLTVHKTNKILLIAGLELGAFVFSRVVL